MDADLDTLATALYVSTDDLLKAQPELAPIRPTVGIAPKLSDAELITLAVMQALLGFTKETQWLRYAKTHLSQQFPYLPGQPGYNKRLRAAPFLLKAVIRHLAIQTDTFTDDVWVVDSTPVECGRSKETAQRSDLAGWAGYGYCASHTRYFWGFAPAPGVHPGRPTHHVRGVQPQRRRTRSADEHVPGRTQSGR